ncbi:MAG: hypothetical protein AAGA99_16405 [Actinomycetota bacterium]
MLTRGLVVAGLLVVGVLVGCAGDLEPERSGVGRPGPSGEAADDGRWAVVEDRSSVERIELRGRAVAGETRDLVAPTSGIVTALDLRAGSRLEPGDGVGLVVARADELDALRAADDAVLAAIADGVDGVALDELVAARAAAARALADAPLGSEQAEAVVIDTAVVVVEPLVRIGDAVEAGQPLALVGDPSAVEVVLTVDAEVADDLVRSDRTVRAVADDDPTGLELRLDAEEPIVGRDEELETATIRLVAAGQALPLGARLTVSVPVEPLPDTLSVPIDAVRSFEEQPFVLIDGERGLERVDVLVVRTGAERADVRGPLEPDTRVLVR